MNRWKWTLVRLLIYALVYFMVSKVMPVPYIDEEAHVPQAMAYCRGDWSRWDTKITTPPGLYLGSWLLLQPVRLMFWLMDRRNDQYCIEPGVCAAEWCSLQWLRATQLFWVAVFEWIGSYSTFIVSMVPLLVPSIFLYYTDVGSLFWVMMMRRFAETGHRKISSNILAAICGAIALLYRQTNVAWILLSASEVALFVAGIRKETKGSCVTDLIDACLKILQNFPSRVFPCIWPYILVVCTFLSFLWLNGGAAMGDRDAHQIVFHLPQLFYASVALTVMALPVASFRMGRTGLWTFIGILALHLVAIRYLTIEHPYLLSDPRHIAVALWRRFMRQYWWSRYVYGPAYVFLELVLVKQLASCIGAVRTVAFIIATALAVVPSPLVEPRYFVVPTVLFLEYCLAKQQHKAIMYYHFSWLVFLSCLFFLTKTHFIW